jgi:hypothetical protein
MYHQTPQKPAAAQHGRTTSHATSDLPKDTTDGLDQLAIYLANNPYPQSKTITFPIRRIFHSDSLDMKSSREDFGALNPPPNQYEEGNRNPVSREKKQDENVLHYTPGHQSRLPDIENFHNAGYRPHSPNTKTNSQIRGTSSTSQTSASGPESKASYFNAENALSVMVEQSAFPIANSNSRNGSPFRPSKMLLEQKGFIQRPKAPNANWKGDSYSSSELDRAPNIPDILNCGLWITNIPITVSLSQFFDCIHLGAVFSVTLYPPKDTHHMMAAKLVFKKPESAQALLTQANAVGFWFGGSPVRVVYWRPGCAQREGAETRVLQIEGPVDLMNIDHWTEYFGNACIYLLERWMFLPCSKQSRKKMEFRFARIDGQATMCRQKILKDHTYQGRVFVQFGPDPCED